MFRLIAIKTPAEKKRFITLPSNRKKVDPFKILQPNTVYPFYSNYSFPSNNFSDIRIDEGCSVDLYSIKAGKHYLPISVSALVGKNGSGKSSLIELLYLANYNIGCILGLLRNSKSNRALKPFKELELEILYAVDDKYYLIKLAKGLINQSILSIAEDGQTNYRQTFRSQNKFDFKNFFYTITLNYSHYSLNAKETGSWVNSLFHKNDGYQTPIVLNPKRNNGDINIENEKKLLKRRLIANLLQDIKDKRPEDTLRNVANGKIAVSIQLNFNAAKIKTINEELNESRFELDKQKLIGIIETEFQFSIFENLFEHDQFKNLLIKYIYHKLIKINQTYSPYKKYQIDYDGKSSMKNPRAFINDIRTSNSHIFFKIKGAILYLKYFSRLLGNNLAYDKPFQLNIDEHALKIQSIVKEEDIFINTYMLAPPSLFNTSIILDDSSNISDLSSGEKQKLHSISSIIYHLINLNSVSDFNGKLDPKEQFHGYSYLNIVLDEIELYYHPEWQRTYIYDLLKSIESINPQNLVHIKGINITFLTHSPYILSDIPISNVLKLNEGKLLEPENNNQTYGANIYDLLTDSFFLNKYFIGEKARLDIQKLINTLQKEGKFEPQDVFNEPPSLLKKRIEIISEDFLRTKLLDMYYIKFKDARQNKIEQLEEQLRNLKG